MKQKELLTPDYVFEASWEVCNKVGGIYTVLSTRAKTLQSIVGDRLIFIGPEVWQGKENPLFVEEKKTFAAWKKAFMKEKGLSVRVGRWNIPGNPLAFLVDFTLLYEQKNAIYAQMWEWSGVDSMHAYGDYDEASMFAYATGLVVESFYRHQKLAGKQVVYQAHEWMSALGLLYVRHTVPAIATIFTTHATSIGRSIAGNYKPLYDYLSAYDGDQMARELNMEAKHSVEKQAAHLTHVFTTVSHITAHECEELLYKRPDVVQYNGFEADFVPKGRAFTVKRAAARKKLLQVANALTGAPISEDTLIIGTSGRYEFKNKGIDLYIEALNRLRFDERCQRPVVAFITVPAWAGEAREDLSARLQSSQLYDTALDAPYSTHQLYDYDGDKVIGMLRQYGITNAPDEKVKIIFIPKYLDGQDGILQLPYYDMLIGQDLSIYPSYYEPWGYTPLESIAFRVPTITTNLSGFGLWVNEVWKKEGMMTDGVRVISRTDSNYHEVADEMKESILTFAGLLPETVEKIRKKVGELSKKAYWTAFIAAYQEAYDLALRKTQQDNQ